jgi:hypothetical protein
MAMAGAVTFGTAAADQLLLAIANDRSAVRTDALVGTLGKMAHVVAGAAGLAFTADRTAVAFEWSDVRSIAVRRASVVVRTEAVRQRVVRTKDGGTHVRRTVEKESRAFRLLVDDVQEPGLSVTFARVLEDMRTGAFSTHGTSWHEHQNAVDRLRGEFSDQDDAVLPIAAAGLWLAIGLMSTFLLAVLVNVAAARSIPPATFTLAHRIGPLDPRTIIAAFAFAALAATFVLRMALGRHATVWARGAARGWHHGGGKLRGFAVRQLGRLILGTSSAAAIVLLACLTFWPNIAATVLIDKDGVRNEVLLPFISLEESWRDATEISRVDAADPRDRPGVRIRFADGREVTTIGQDLGGGTEGQLFEVASNWRKAAR